MKKAFLMFGLVMFCSIGLAHAQAASHEVVNLADAKFSANPALPACVKIAPVHGDPSQANFVILMKATAGCAIPTHWHTANEQVGIVSGNFQLTSKDEKPSSMKAGSYAFLPSKNQHSAKCMTGCTLFLAADQPFDIHYVDASGSEIPPDQALKSGGKAATKAAKPAAPKKSEKAEPKK